MTAGTVLVVIFFMKGNNRAVPAVADSSFRDRIATSSADAGTPRNDMQGITAPALSLREGPTQVGPTDDSGDGSRCHLFHER